MTLINRIRTFVTSGDENSSSQAFYNNYYATPRSSKIPIFSHEIPTYKTIGGTKRYYEQDPLSIFTNLSKPFIRFTFTGSTSAITEVKLITHKIYKVDYDSFKNFQINQPSTNIEKDVISKSGTLSKEANFSQKSRQKLGGNKIIEFSRAYNQILTQEDTKLLQPLLSEPVTIITASTQGITTNIYDFYPEQYIKKSGELKQELFEDRSQYFIDTEFKFEIDKGLNYENFFTDISGATEEKKWENIIELSTSDKTHTITQGEFTGLEIQGSYFTYFLVPEKPILEYPLIEGVLTTFAPEFFWSNGEKSDEYLIQVSYNTGDTTFSGTVFNYPILKTDDNKKIANSTINETDSQFTSTKTIRSGSVSLKGNSSSFNYRIGNVKTLVNIFGVRQFVVTFSDYKTATTQINPIQTYVLVQSDSPYIETITPFTIPESIINESPLPEFMLSGVVTGSIITGATMQLTFPNLAYITTTTDLSGYFEFVDLEEGIYTLETNYRGYEGDSRSINITGDTSLSLELQIRWDDIYDNWSYKENDIIKY